MLVDNWHSLDETLIFWKMNAGFKDYVMDAEKS